MVSFAEISQPLSELQEHENTLPIPSQILPEDQQVVRATWDLTFTLEPSPLGRGRPLTNEEFFQALHYMREAHRNAFGQLGELVRIASNVQCILHKIKLRRNLCIHSQKSREKFQLVAKTVTSAARGIFKFIFGDIRAAGNVNFDALNDVSRQRKQVEAIAASVHAIPKEIKCDKLNRVVSENEAIGY